MARDPAEVRSAQHSVSGRFLCCDAVLCSQQGAQFAVYTSVEWKQVLEKWGKEEVRVCHGGAEARRVGDEALVRAGVREKSEADTEEVIRGVPEIWAVARDISSPAVSKMEVWARLTSSIQEKSSYV